MTVYKYSAIKWSHKAGTVLQEELRCVLLVFTFVYLYKILYFHFKINRTCLFSRYPYRGQVQVLRYEKFHLLSLSKPEVKYLNKYLSI